MNELYEIMLVEDNENDAELTMRALKKNNMTRLIHLKDGEEALEYIFATGKYSQRNINELPKVIFMDLKMPKVGGFEVLKKIKSDERTRNVPVVVLTSSKEDADVIEAYTLGANSYIVKPVGFENFAKVVWNMGQYWLSVNHLSK